MTLTLMLKLNLDMVKMYVLKMYGQNEVNSFKSYSLNRWTDSRTNRQTHRHYENITSTVYAGGNYSFWQSCKNTKVQKTFLSSLIMNLYSKTNTTIIIWKLNKYQHDNRYLANNTKSFVNFSFFIGQMICKCTMITLHVNCCSAFVM